MDAMRTMCRLAAGAAATLLLSSIAGGAQTPDQLAVIRRLGPDGFASAPPLAALVEGTAVAIVGRVLGTDGFAERAGDGYVAYRIAVDEVLFSREIDGVPPVAAGTVVRLEQSGRGDSARRYFAGELPPVGTSDSCLLFLRAESPGLLLMGWTVHFRRGAEAMPTAQTLGGASLAAEMAKPYWFGPRVRMVTTQGGAAPEWESLLAEVRRLGIVDASAARQR